MWAICAGVWALEVGISGQRDVIVFIKYCHCSKRDKPATCIYRWSYMHSLCTAVSKTEKNHDSFSLDLWTSFSFLPCWWCLFWTGSFSWHFGWYRRGLFVQSCKLSPSAHRPSKQEIKRLWQFKLDLCGLHGTPGWSQCCV